MWDWFQCYLENGIFDNEAQTLQSRLVGHGFGFDVLDQFLQLWCWPRGYAGAHKVAKLGKLVASGSEQLSFYPVYRMLLISITADMLLPGEVASMMALFTVLDLLVTLIESTFTSSRKRF